MRALLDKHLPGISIRRDAVLGLLENRGDVTLRELALAFVQPLVAKLDDPDGGPEFLMVAAQLVNEATRVIDPEAPVGAVVYDREGTLERWGRLVEPLIPEGAAGAPLHRRFAAIRFAYTELGRRAQEPAGSGADHRLFTSQLADLVTALLGAEVSPETRTLLERRG